MSEETRKFVGRAIVIDKATGEDSEFSAYVCLLLSGKGRVPQVTVCEAPTLDELLKKIRASDVHALYAHAPFTFDPPPLLYPVTHSSARQRYEALSFDEFNRAQTFLSGR